MESIIENQVLFNNVAEIELVYKHTVKPSLRPVVTSSKEAYHILLDGWDQNKIEFVEQLKIMFLSRDKKVLAIYEMSTGGTSSTVIDAKLIFSAALKINASGIIMSHNHPSGCLKPSNSDIISTQKIKEGGKLLDIEVLDHLIITTEGYTSILDEGLL